MINGSTLELNLKFVGDKKTFLPFFCHGPVASYPEIFLGLIASCPGFSYVQPADNGNLNSHPGTEQWPRQTTSGDLVMSLQLVFA